MKSNPFLLVFFLFVFEVLSAQEQLSRFQSIDILHYSFHLNLSDSSDVIFGKADIKLRLKQEVNELEFDLAGKDMVTQRGMEVTRVLIENKPGKFVHTKDQLSILSNELHNLGDTMHIHVEYSGIPSDGLVISSSKYGQRTFFGDNWPNRAHYWIPCIDHPSDKATVEFKVICPENYQVIASGIQIEESNTTDNRKIHHWKSDIKLPTKVMVIGVAEFAVQQLGEIQNIPLSSWVYPENREEGFYDYAVANRILEFFVKKIGPFPFEKLANVQSKTRWGGMENAGNIFYFERSVTGRREHENLFAHEIAHQWFGDSASELDWHHVWLSEGFATYLTDVFVEAHYGNEVMQKKMQDERLSVIKYSKRNFAPIVDTSITNINKVLSTNTYQKAAWVLHMLRNKIGDEIFWKCIRNYYDRYKFSNALTEDFQKICEDIYGENLSWFFQQWFYQAGHPILEFHWEQDLNSHCKVHITQTQKNTLFRFPLVIQIHREKLPSIFKKIDIRSDLEELKFHVNGNITDISLDPETILLFEIK